MRGKGERHIPDFSRKPKPEVHGANAPETERKSAPARAPVRGTQPKPHGTSAKSGRRGS